MSADARYQELMLVEKIARATLPSTTRLYWKAVVKMGKQTGIGGMTRSEIEWHDQFCPAPANDCHGCEPQPNCDA